MGKGRAPCCDKTKVKRGPWSPEEDLKLISFIHKFGHENWRSLPKQSGLLRCGKSCRLRWINYLRPDVKRGNFTLEEEETIIKLHQNYGNKWSKIASKLPGRTDNEIKNVWHTHLKKRLVHNSDEPASPCSNDSVSIQKDDKSLLGQESLKINNSHHELSSCEDDQNTGLMFEYSEFDDMIQEVDKPNLCLEIPFDSDPDIWSYLDGTNTFQQATTTTNENSLVSRTQEEEEDEVKKWFKHLESELGLEEDDNQQHKQGTQQQHQEEESSSSLLKTYELMIH
ncbi:unnamed protein product [Cochlearia groenlandica]